MTGKKVDFHFINGNGSTRRPEKGDYFYQFEYRYSFKWPFFQKVLIGYQLINDEWAPVIQFKKCKEKKP